MKSSMCHAYIKHKNGIFSKKRKKKEVKTVELNELKLKNPSYKSCFSGFISEKCYFIFNKSQWIFCISMTLLKLMLITLYRTPHCNIVLQNIRKNIQKLPFFFMQFFLFYCIFQLLAPCSAE